MDNVAVAEINCLQSLLPEIDLLAFNIRGCHPITDLLCAFHTHSENVTKAIPQKTHSPKYTTMNDEKHSVLPSQLPFFIHLPPCRHRGFSPQVSQESLCRVLSF